MLTRVHLFLSTLKSPLSLFSVQLGSLLAFRAVSYSTRAFLFILPPRLHTLYRTMLYRTTAARSVLRAISTSNSYVARSTLSRNVFKAQLTSSARQPARLTSSPSLALAFHKPATTSLVRYAATFPKAERVSIKPVNCNM